MLVNPNDLYIGKALLEYGEYGEAESSFLLQLLALNRPGLIIEVGANIGAHTVALAAEAHRRQQAMQVFEPQPVIFQNLCANLSANGFEHVRAWPFACGAKPGIVHFNNPNYRATGNFGGISMQTEATGGTTRVSCVALDDMLGGEIVSLIKIDVEGFELSVLQGAEQTLTHSRPMLYVENDRVDRSQALIEWLWSKQYRLWWHVTPLFNPDNFFGRSDNIYGNLSSFNMFGLPQESVVPVEGLPVIVDAAYHPLRAEAG